MSSRTDPETAAAMMEAAGTEAGVPVTASVRFDDGSEDPWIVTAWKEDGDLFSIGCTAWHLRCGLQPDPLSIFRAWLGGGAS